MSARKDQPLTCTDCRAQMQDYLDETLPRVEATRFFLHVRECEGCARELEEFKSLFGLLGSLPAVEAPADFDAAVLQSVPYEAYRAMEPIRRERVPVLLEPESLPAPLRAGETRIAGLVLAAAAAGLGAAGRLPGDPAAILALVGVLPEGLLRLQQLGRRIYAGAVRQSESG